MTFLTSIMEYGFLQRALATSVMVGVFSGVIGSFIILRGMSLMGDAISHAVLPGVAISYMLDINLFIGAAATGMLTALGIGYVSQASDLKNDTAIGIVFSAAFALGIILIAFARASSNLHNVLFGHVLAVSAADVWLTFGIGVIVMLGIALFYKELLISSFDPTMAAAYGLPNRFIHYFLIAMLTLITVASLQTVGIVLVVAMLVTPAASAFLLTNRLAHMLWISAAFGVVASVIGLYFSFVYNIPSGAAVVMAATVLFGITFIFSPKRGRRALLRGRTIRREEMTVE